MVWQIILTVVFYVWLFLVLVLLYNMWQSGIQQARNLQQALVDTTLKTAEAAQLSAETAHLLSKEAFKQHESQ